MDRLTAMHRAVVCVAMPLLCVSRAPAADAQDPIAWSDVVASYAAVDDYTCLYHKEERAIEHGVRQTIRLSFRKPLDVRMEWLGDRGDVTQVAVFRQGHNDGRLLARGFGLIGSLLGRLDMDPHDRRAMADSRHPITEVGIGFVVDRVATALAAGDIRMSPSALGTLDAAAVWRFDMETTGAKPLLSIETARAARVAIDRTTRLPVEVEIVDAARQMIEHHRYTDVRLNVGLADAVFTL